MSQTTTPPPLTLVPLGPEPWGSKLARARTNAGFKSVEKVAAVIPAAFSLSKSTIGRLEKRVLPPDSAKDRTKVALLCILYRTDLADLDVSLADIPPVFDLQSLSDLGILSPGWFGGIARRVPELAA